MTRILGISAFYHDSAACLLEDGRIVAALQEERFSRVKHDDSFPTRAVGKCLEMGKCRMEDLDFVVFYEKPFVKFERLLETYSQHCPRGLRAFLKAMPLWIKEKLWIKETICKSLDFKGEILFADHHESHAASAFFPSPFQSAAILTVDGVGEWSTTTLGAGRSNELELKWDIRFPHSLGLLYTAFTYYLGFKINSGEYKMMGLAPYGKPRYAARIREHLIQIEEDGSFRLERGYFDYESGLRMTSDKFDELFQGPVRSPEEPITQRHMDIAASIQQVTETVLLKTASQLRRISGEVNLCMAGGVALNCVSNGKILRQAGFERLWIQPAAGDAGGALGAALLVWHRFLEKPRQAAAEDRDRQQASLLGTAYSPAQISQVLRDCGAVCRELDDSQLLAESSRLLAQGGVLGWFQGRMEFGPRALGNRSILADPRGSAQRDHVNMRIKFRESFRPFAPAVLVEETGDYFELDCPSPYMLLVASVVSEKRAEIPSVTHVDGSARIQTVDSRDNFRFAALLKEFFSETGCPVLLNTSFNVRGEPIVESPGDAFQSFMRTGMDALVIGNFMCLKKDQPTGL